MNGQYGIMIGAAAAIIAVIVIVLLWRRRGKKRQTRQNIEDKLREEALDRILLGDQANSASPSVPFDVRYDLREQKKQKTDVSAGTGSPMMLQITERSELSTRKYMFDPRKGVVFGSATANEIVIVTPGVEARQCELLLMGEDLYLRNLSERTTGIVRLRRKRKHLTLETNVVQVKGGDVLEIGNYLYEIEMIPA